MTFTSKQINGIQNLVELARKATANEPGDVTVFNINRDEDEDWMTEDVLRAAAARMRAELRLDARVTDLGIRVVGRLR